MGFSYGYDTSLPSEFGKDMNTSSVNPYHVGMTPIEFMKRTASMPQNQKSNSPC